MTDSLLQNHTDIKIKQAFVNNFFKVVKFQNECHTDAQILNRLQISSFLLRFLF